jgi:L-iditol 2-dehydrogenase
MKVIRLHASADLRFHDEPDPIPSAGEKQLQVKAVGICGSDLHWIKEGGIGNARLEHPLVHGHEFAGVLVNGQRVAVDPAIPCMACEFCLRGHPNLCPEVRFAGHGEIDGALREVMACDEKCLIPIPDSLTYADGAMLEPLGVALHAVDLAHLRVGMTVGVFGCGPIGLLIIQVAKLSGAVNIIATDKLTHCMDVAKAFGAKMVLLVGGGKERAELLAATGGRGVDEAFVVAGDQSAVDDAISTVIPGEKVILVGIPGDDNTSFTASIARQKGLTIKLVHRMKHTYPRAIALVSKRLVDVSSLVSHRFPLAQAAEAFAVAERREGLKVIVEC